MTTHWVKVEEQIETVEGNEVVRYHWSLQPAIIGFRTISGTHSGENLGRYMVGVMDWMGIMGRNFSKVSIHRSEISDATYGQWGSVDKIHQLLCVTLNNASSNKTSCETIEAIHDRRKLGSWSAEGKQLP